MSSVSIDSRRVKRGGLFVALRGARHDGHDFLAEAARSGAGAVLIERRGLRLPEDVAVFLVEDTVRALGLLAAHHRRRWGRTVVAVTGSAGKTTTKDLIAAVLSGKGPVLKNEGTQNNQIGVPLTLLRLSARHRIAVLELGTNRPGEIARLAGIARPDVAVWTNIGESHLEGLGTVGRIFREKAALRDALPPGGRGWVNGEDPRLRTLLSDGGRVVIKSYGTRPEDDVRAEEIRLLPDGRQTFRIGPRTTVRLDNPAAVNVINALAAVACGRTCGVGLKRIAAGLEACRFPPQRQEVKRAGGLVIIDDTYNANPVSFRSALDTLRRLPIRGRRVLVCGDMLELGPRAETLHRGIGRLAALGGVEVVFAYGTLAARIAEAASEVRPGIRAVAATRRSALHRRLLGFCRPGDGLLVKGSRGMGMEVTVRFLTEAFATSH